LTLSGIELTFLTNSISKISKDYYVSNIYGIDSKSILFKLHHPEKPDILLMFSTMGIWVTSNKVEQIEVNKMLKRLRSDLIRLKITKVEQIGVERIAYLTFGDFDKEFILIGEFFGDTKEIIELCQNKLKSGGRIVVGVILIETLYSVLSIMDKLNFNSVDITQITISKSRKTSTGTMMLARNPVTVISATKS